MNYIENWFHFYDTTESFEVHRKQGLIKPDSICFLRETAQIYTQKNFFGICKDRYEKLEQLALEHEAKIRNIFGIEGPSVNDGIVNNIADIVAFLDGFTDKDNLKEFIKAIETSLSNRITALEQTISNDFEELKLAINAIKSQIKTIDIRLDNHDTVLATLSTSLASHIREYNLLKSSYENFKSYTETNFTAINNSISSLNISIQTLQEYFEELDEKFDDVENKVSGVESLLEDANLLVKQLEDRFGQTLAELEQFKRDIKEEMKDFQDSVGEPNGIAPLDSRGQVPAEHLPSYVDDVLEYPTKAAFPVTGETGKIYVALDTNLQYRWSGTQYIELSKSLGLGETSSTAYPGDKGKKVTDNLAAHKADYDNPHRVTKTQLGLNKVNNTSDLEKPISTATKEALETQRDEIMEEIKAIKDNSKEVAALRDEVEKLKESLDWGEF